MDHATIYIGLAALFGFFMAWGIGANDVANAMGTSVGAKVLTVRNAFIVAMIFEFAGAVLAGGEVTSTIRKGIVNPALFENDPETLIWGMLAALLAAGTWLLVASQRGWPVSTTHSIVGAIVGFAVVGAGFESVDWSKIGTIAMSWVVSPLVSGIFAFGIFQSVQWLILSRSDPLACARRYVPGYMFLAAFMISLVTMLKGLKHVGLDLDPATSVTLAASIAVGISIIGAIFISRIEVDPKADKKFHYYTVERVFGVLMVVTACGMAFAHGSNDVANAIGPLAAVLSAVASGVGAKAATPTWVLLLGGLGIAIGLATYGRRVMGTVGERITQLTPSRGFAAEIAASTTIV
ncbi:MAG: inorganic phosphate transporter, partial [Gammaproteobacteria bacterium]|nr:inorganic phosphate transporter [Gammaproteobacteria bacterium]